MKSEKMNLSTFILNAQKDKAVKGLVYAPIRRLDEGYGIVSDGFQLRFLEGDWKDLENEWLAFQLSGQFLNRLKKGYSYFGSVSFTSLKKQFRRPGNLERDRTWFKYLKNVRRVMESLGMEEVFTPFLVSSPGVEPFLEPFQLEKRIGKKKKTCYLPTSPEFHLKKLLADGWSHIFEIKPSFRNEEESPHHLSEFYMLEWYRTCANLNKIENDLISLITSLAEPLGFQLPQLVKFSVAEIFKIYVGKNLTPQTTREELLNWCEEFKLNWCEDDLWDDLFFRIFLEKIEPDLLTQEPFFLLYDYPPSQAALSRLNDKGWANRFELYFMGLEIANAYDELLDDQLVLKRLTEANRVRSEMGKKTIDLDEDLITAHKEFIPETSGIALGLDRLFMVLNKKKSISEVRTYFT